MADKYTITGQRPTSMSGPGGVIVPAIEVSFETKPNNIAGTVRIPQAGYTKQAVHDAVHHQAHVMEEIQSL